MVIFHSYVSLPEGICANIWCILVGSMAHHIYQHHGSVMGLEMNGFSWFFPSTPLTLAVGTGKDIPRYPQIMVCRFGLGYAGVIEFVIDGESDREPCSQLTSIQ